MPMNVLEAAWPATLVFAAILLTAVIFFVAIVVILGREGYSGAGTRSLQAAIAARTAELDRERVREQARSAILEQLVANEPLGVVLDGIAADFRREVPGSLCCILLRRNQSWHVVAGPGVPPSWSAALRGKNVIPSDGDSGLKTTPVKSDWQPFLDAVSGPHPREIHCRQVGNSQSQIGILLGFETEEAPPCEPGELERALQASAQLAFIAIEHWRYCEDLRYRAHHDDLTGLPNRELFEERLAQSLLEAAATRQPLAVLSLDVDRFKRVNETLGHRAADIVLAEVATRIRKSLRLGDVVARMGADEFMVIVANTQSRPEVDDICNRILDAVRQPMLVSGKAIAPTVSIGCAFFPADAGDADSLRRRAEAAMQCAKSFGRNRIQAYGAQIDALDRVRLEEEIRDALEFNRFSVHYQPKIDATGIFCGFEALVRLSSSVVGGLSPGQFIPVAEESGLIHFLGAWVLAEVCAQMVDWHNRNLGWVPVAVNVSPAQISRPGFAEEVKSCLQSAGVPATYIELELTESIVLGGSLEGERQMRELRSCGIRFSIDDFGTGYSSLSYLYRLPVDAIKLDRSFVQAISTDEPARRLVQAMIGVAGGLGLDVIAEGVETDEQRLALIAAGCPVMQGYFFARPAPAAEMEGFLRKEPLPAPVPEPSTPSDTPCPPSVSDDLIRLHDSLEVASLLAV